MRDPNSFHDPNLILTLTLKSSNSRLKGCRTWKCPHFSGVKFKSVLVTQESTHRHKATCQLSGLLAPRENGNRSVKLLLCLLPVSVRLYPPPPSILCSCSCTSSSTRCVHASLSASKSFIPRRPGALHAAAGSPVCVGTMHHEPHPHDLVLTLQWMAGCFDSAVSLITSPSPFCMNCFPDNDHKSSCMPDATKYAGLLCHELMIMCLLPERLEQTAIRDIVFRSSGGVRHPLQGQNTGFIRAQANQIVYNTTVKASAVYWLAKVIIHLCWQHDDIRDPQKCGLVDVSPLVIQRRLSLSASPTTELFTSSTLPIHKHLITHTNLFFHYSLAIVKLQNRPQS